MGLEIIENQTFSMTNVLVFNGRLSKAEVEDKDNELAQIISTSGAKQIGPRASFANTFNEGTNQQVAEVEYLIPIDKAIIPPPGLRFFESFSIDNTVKVHYVGNPTLLQGKTAEIEQYMDARGYVPKKCYTIVVKGGETPLEMNSMIIDMYFVI